MILSTSVRVDMNDTLVLSKNQWWALVAFFSDISHRAQFNMFTPGQIEMECTVFTAHYRDTFAGSAEEMHILYYMGLAYMAYRGDSIEVVRREAYVLPPHLPGNVLTPIMFRDLVGCGSLKSMLMLLMRLPDDLLPDLDTEDVLVIFHLAWELNMLPIGVIKRLGLKVNSTELIYS